MKKLYIILSIYLFVFIYPGSTFGQSYQRFLSDNTEWDVYAGTVPVKTSSSQAFLSGPVLAIEDTVIGIYTYKKAYSRTEDITIFGSKPCLIREDTASKKVYILSADSSNERVLYDFNLVAGDSIYLAFRYGITFQQALKSGWYYVDSTGTINTLSGIRNTWFFSNPLISSPFPGLPQLKWIEGIGSTISPVYLDEEFDYTFITINPEAQYYLALTCAFHDSLAVFHDSIWKAVYIQNVQQLFGDSCVFNFTGSVGELRSVRQSLNFKPNPMLGKTMISLNNFNADNDKKYLLTVSDLAGREIFHLYVNGKDLNNGYDLYRNSMQGGNYFIYLYDDKRLFAAGKLVVQ